MENMFAATTDGGNVQTRGLYHTAELTQRSTDIAKQILKVVLNEETYREAIVKSQKSADDMDELIATVFDFSTGDFSFLADAELDELERMLKSQQSKRSRTKGKSMTLENYTTMMTAAVAEKILRTVGGIPKGSIGNVRTTTGLYSVEELEAFKQDQESLGKAIRNVQSKKCIMKGKANFDAESDEFKQLLDIEQQLKSVRSGAAPTAVASEVVAKAEKIEQLETILPADEEIDKMSARDVKALLAQIKGTIAN